MRTRLAWLFPRASERRVFLKWRSAIHPYIFILTSSHAHIFTSSHPHLLTSSISFFSSSHLHLFISSHHRQNLNLHVLTSPRHILKSSYHNIFFSSHPHLFTSSISFFSSYIFISSYLHTLYIIFYIFFFLRYLDIFLSLCFMLYHLLTYIFHYISLRSRAIRRLVFLYPKCQDNRKKELRQGKWGWSGNSFWWRSLLHTMYHSYRIILYIITCIYHIHSICSHPNCYKASASEGFYIPGLTGRSEIPSGVPSADLKTTVQETQGIQGLLCKLLDILQPNQKDPDTNPWDILR